MRLLLVSGLVTLVPFCHVGKFIAVFKNAFKFFCLVGKLNEFFRRREHFLI